MVKFQFINPKRKWKREQQNAMCEKGEREEEGAQGETDKTKGILY